MKMYEMKCPACSKKIQFPETWIDREGVCTYCSKKVVFTRKQEPSKPALVKKTPAVTEKAPQNFKLLKDILGYCTTFGILILGAMFYLSDCSCAPKPNSNPPHTEKVQAERGVTDSELIGQARIMTRKQVKRKLIAEKDISFSNETHKVFDYELDSNIKIINTLGKVTAPTLSGIYRTARFSSTIHYDKRDKSYYLKHFSLEQ